MVVPIVRERLAAVPNIPVVGISPVLVPGVIIISSRGWRGRPIERDRVLFLQDFRNDILENLDIIALLLDGRLPRPVQCLCLHLIVTAPDAKTGVMADPPHIVADLRTDAALEALIQLVGGAGKHKILPHDQPQFIADIEEPVVWVIAAAPDTDTVVVRRCRVLQESAGALRCDARKNIVLRDIVRTHRKNLHPVYLVGKTFSPLVLVRIHSHGAQADPAAPLIKHIARPVKERHFRPVKGLFPETVGPPAFRVVYGDGVPAVSADFLFCAPCLLLRLLCAPPGRLRPNQYAVRIIKSRANLISVPVCEILDLHGIYDVNLISSRYVMTYVNQLFLWSLITL